jgi:hypothetical protein
MSVAQATFSKRHGQFHLQFQREDFSITVTQKVSHPPVSPKKGFLFSRETVMLNKYSKDISG